MRDDLGQRIKENYENRTRYYLPRWTYTLIRIDGKNFHNYTKNLKKPFDLKLIADFDNATKKVLDQIQGAKFAYLQSDEISILLCDFDKPTTAAWFDGNIQKIASVSASLMTAEFNQYRFIRELERHIGICVSYTEFNKATFDARCFTIADRVEVYNAILWRIQDAARNSISMVAQSLFSHKELQNKNGKEMQEMMFQRGINWADYPEDLKNGRFIIKNERNEWSVVPCPKITENPAFLMEMIPKIN